MDIAIWLLLLVWLPSLWYKAGSILDVLKDIRDILKRKSGE